MRRFLPRWPRMLLVVVLAIAVSTALDLADHGVAVTGDVPTGLFSVGLPDIDGGHAGALLVGALSIVFVGYSESLAAARAMARKHRYEIDVDQELIAQGFACGAAGLVGGFATDGSLSKTSVADAAGQRTQVASLINAVLILLTMLVLAGLFEQLPSATLAAVVVDAMLGLITFAEWRRYYTVNRPDWLFFMGAGLGILFFGIIQGILIGVVLSLLLLIWRSSRTSIRELRRDPAQGTFHVVSRHGDLVELPGILVVRVDGPLFFADADRFRTRVRELIARAPRHAPGRDRRRRDPPDRHRRRGHHRRGRRGAGRAGRRACVRRGAPAGARAVGARRGLRRDRPRGRLRDAGRRGRRRALRPIGVTTTRRPCSSLLSMEPRC